MNAFDMTIWDGKASALLLSALQACASREQAKAVLADMLTEKEINDLGHRLRIALMLENGRSYLHIRQSLGVSTATIAEVSKKLKTGSGGYGLVLRLIKEQQSDRQLAILAGNEQPK